AWQGIQSLARVAAWPLYPYMRSDCHDQTALESCSMQELAGSQSGPIRLRRVKIDLLRDLDGKSMPAHQNHAKPV
ncbi:MAG: hypothetical protein P4M14_00055, partial [Gammaproteobacteria bacterium]|nr:hypothetical protein [Gammaproteobacteria bacterium]